MDILPPLLHSHSIESVIRVGVVSTTSVVFHVSWHVGTERTHSLLSTLLLSYLSAMLGGPRGLVGLCFRRDSLQLCALSLTPSLKLQTCVACACRMVLIFLSTCMPCALRLQQHRVSILNDIIQKPKDIWVHGLAGSAHRSCNIGFYSSFS